MGEAKYRSMQKENLLEDTKDFRLEQRFTFKPNTTSHTHLEPQDFYIKAYSCVRKL